MLETIIIIAVALAAAIGFFRVIEGWAEIGNIDETSDPQEHDEWPT